MRGKTTDELLEMKKNLEAGLALINEELADLAARQAAAEPSILAIKSQLNEQRCVREQKAKELSSFFFGGLFNPGEKHALQQQVRSLDAERKRLEASMVAVVEKWNLGDAELASRLDSPYCTERGIRNIWEECRREVAGARHMWTVQEQLSHVYRLLRQRSNAAEQKRREAERVKRREIERAKISAYDGRSRDLTDTVKKTLPAHSNCPYCGESLGETPHADHIYPVTKGGHSVAANMVLVCAACNLKKGSMTLRAFIMKYGLDREAIEMRLHELGKDF
jgi:5-methylcytosine-specific restriction endonuclease McrA